LEQIRTQGLRSDMSRSESYGEPGGVWFSTHQPFYGGEGGYATGPVIELDIAADDPRIIKDAGSWPHPDSQQRIDEWNEQQATVLVNGVIEPHEMRVHEPWHRMARTLENQVDRGQYDDLLEGRGDDYARAVSYWKQSQADAAEQQLDGPSL
jgi:hypothetical protein